MPPSPVEDPPQACVGRIEGGGIKRRRTFGLKGIGLNTVIGEGFNMKSKENDCSRRNFLKSMGVAGIGALVGPAARLPEADAEVQKPHRIPTRPFGKTGDSVSILALGGNGFTSNKLIMHQAVKWGVTFWDTWDSDRSMGGGISQKGVGKYFKQYPNDRKKVFLMTKTDDRGPEALTPFLNKALMEMKTENIDFYVIHSVSDITSIHRGTRAWVENAKKAGKIRYFGVSSHSNMEEVMKGAVELGWIDGVMVTYNYRIMHNERMKKAVEKCHKAGLAIIAMKTQAKSAWHDLGEETETARKLTDSFIEKGFTPAQAKLKAVWSNPHITGLTSMMLNMTNFTANVAAARDKKELSGTDVRLLENYANETRSQYCTGCTQICQSALKSEVPIGDVMRYLMYARTYRDRDRASALYTSLPEQTRADIIDIDYTLAEKRCPQKIAIGKIMRTAAKELGC